MPVSLNANALTALDRTKAELDIDLADTAQDDQIAQYINTASDQIEKICNRVFVQQSYVERFTGMGINWLVTRQFPIISITNIWVDPTYAFAAPLASTTYQIIEAMFIVRLGEANFWPGGAPLSTKAAYDAGYVTIPDGLQQGCIEFVRWLYLSQGDRRMGRTSKSKQGENLSFEDVVPAQVLSLIEPYKRENEIRRALGRSDLFVPPDRRIDGYWGP